MEQLPSIESLVKSQYVKFFEECDWHVFKLLADFYFKNAVKVKKKDIDVSDIYKLLVRNVQKRLFIGIGCELLLKAYLLKNGYCINKPRVQQNGNPIRLAGLNQNEFISDDTYTFNQLIDRLKKIPEFKAYNQVENGLKIAKVFRNKEGHVAVLWHKYEENNYTEIENALKIIYQVGFSEDLDIQISFATNEKGIFRIKPYQIGQDISLKQALS